MEPNWRVALGYHRSARIDLCVLLGAGIVDLSQSAVI